MSAKVPNGLLYDRFHSEEFFLKTPKGGWYLGAIDFMKHLYLAIEHYKTWDWEDKDDARHKGAALVAPLTILVWSKEDE